MGQSRRRRCPTGSASKVDHRKLVPDDDYLVLQPGPNFADERAKLKFVRIEIVGAQPLRHVARGGNRSGVEGLRRVIKLSLLRPASGATGHSFASRSGMTLRPEPGLPRRRWRS